jgi:hypothetical protein
MKDKARLLTDLLKLGVCYRARLSEQDLGVYAEMIDARLDDSEWSEVMEHFTGGHGDVGQEFMPTPLDLISTGMSFRGERERKRAEVAANHKRYMEREERRRSLLSEGDELLHNGECPK